jgi:hypothetical protein
MASASGQNVRSAGAIASGSTGIAAGLLSVVAASCCVSPTLAPLIVGIIGASGAVWAANLKPYTFWILGLAGLSLAYGFWSVYRPAARCETAAQPRRLRILSLVSKGSLWLGAVFWTAALMLQLVLPS